MKNAITLIRQKLSVCTSTLLSTLVAVEIEPVFRKLQNLGSLLSKLPYLQETKANDSVGFLEPTMKAKHGRNDKWKDKTRCQWDAIASLECFVTTLWIKFTNKVTNFVNRLSLFIKDACVSTILKSREKLQPLKIITHSIAQITVANEEDINTNKQIFVPLMLHTKQKLTRIYCQHDTGSDISILNAADLDVLIPKWKSEFDLQPTNVTITSYSQHQIEILGSISVPYSFRHNPKHLFKHDFYVITGHRNILGRDVLKKHEAGLKFSKNEVSLHLNKPLEIKGLLKCKYTTEMELTLTEPLKISLPPRTSKRVNFNLSKLTVNPIGKRILASHFAQDKSTSTPIIMFPSLSLIAKGNNGYETCAVSVHNISDDYIFDETLQCSTLLIKDDQNILSFPDFYDRRSDKFQTNLLAKCKLLKEIIPLQQDCFEAEDIGENVEKNVNFITHEYGKDFQMDVSMIQKSNEEYDQEKQFDIFEQSTAPHIPKEDQQFTLDQALALDKHPKEIQPFLIDIFKQKFPDVVSRTTMESGDLSRTLGFCYLKLKDGCKLPKNKRLFKLSNEDQQHMKDILDYLEKYGFIQKVHLGQHFNQENYGGVPAFLISRKSKEAVARLICDFSQEINTLLDTQPDFLPSCEEKLDTLRHSILFTALDLRQGFYGLSLAPGFSREISQFLTPFGSYHWKRLPTGIRSSPRFYQAALESAIHHEVARDENGDIIWEAPSRVKLIPDKIKEAEVYIDDVILHSPRLSNWQKTLNYHFQIVEKVVSRLSFHSILLNLTKCFFAQQKLLYLGWVIEEGRLTVDPKRIEKIRDLQFPTSVTEAKKVLGLVRSIGRVCPLSTGEYMHTLNELTQTTVAFKPQKIHKEAFSLLIEKLTTEPLFAYCFNPNAPKVLFCDSSKFIYGAVLLQERQNWRPERNFPQYLDEQDSLHQTMYNHEYTLRPLEKLLPDNNNFLNTILQTLKFWKCKVPESTADCKLEIVKNLKISSTGRQIKHKVFNGNHQRFLDFLWKLQQPNSSMDDHGALVRAVSEYFKRTLVFIFNVPGCANKPELEINPDYKHKPIIYLGVKLQQPHINNTNLKSLTNATFQAFYKPKLSDVVEDNRLQNKLEAVYYLTKAHTKNDQDKDILQLESIALLQSVLRFSHYLKGSQPVTAFVDNLALYYLCNAHMSLASKRIHNALTLLVHEYPNLSVKFAKGSANLSDFFSRLGLQKAETQKFKLRDLSVHPFEPEKDSYTLSEWIKWVYDHPQFLKVEQKNIPKLVNMLESTLQPITNLITVNLKDTHRLYKLMVPIQELYDRMDRNALIRRQKQDLSEIYQEGLKHAEIFEYNKKQYQMKHNILYIKVNDDFVIYVPKSLEATCMVLEHLLMSSHKGAEHLALSIKQNYHIDGLVAKARSLCQSCFTCFLVIHKRTKHHLGIHKISNHRPFAVVYMDLIENLGLIEESYNHVLLIKCPMTEFMICYPLKAKTSNAILLWFFHGFCQSHGLPLKVITDNSQVFRSKVFLSFLGALSIEVCQTARFSSHSRGSIESYVKIVRSSLKKMIHILQESNYNWRYLNVLASLQHNSTVSRTTGYSPSVLVSGYLHDESLTMNNPLLPKLHPKIRHASEFVSHMQHELKDMRLKAQDTINETHMATKRYYDRGAVKANLKEGDIVFLRDKSIVEGDAKPLRPYYQSSAFMVLKNYEHTCQIARLSDNFTVIACVNDLKKFHKTIGHLFPDLPPRIKQLCQINYKDLTQEQLNLFAKTDRFPIINITPDYADIDIDSIADDPNEEELDETLSPFYDFPEHFGSDQDQDLPEPRTRQPPADIDHNLDWSDDEDQDQIQEKRSKAQHDRGKDVNLYSNPDKEMAQETQEKSIEEQNILPTNVGVLPPILEMPTEVEEPTTLDFVPDEFQELSDDEIIEEDDQIIPEAGKRLFYDRQAKKDIHW